MNKKDEMDNGFKPGDWVDVEVFKTTNFGAFVSLPNGGRGLIHISQVADTYVKDINEFVKVGDKLKARIVTIGPAGKIDLSLKAATATPKREFRSTGFEDKLKAFLRKSEERPSDLKHNIEENRG